MNSGRYSRIWLVLTSLLVVHALVFMQVRQFREPSKRTMNIRSLPLPPSFYSVLAGEFRGITADFLYLDTASLLGGRGTPQLTETEWNGLEQMFATAMELDPYFSPTFRAVQAYLPWLAKRYQAANQLLTKAAEHRTWDWLPLFFKGFNYYFFLDDPKAASATFLSAAQREHAPSMLATFGGRLAADADGEDAGIELLTRLLQTKESESERKPLQDRIDALRGLKELKQLIARYKEEQGVPPPNLHDLVFLGYVRELPVNPYNKEFFYKEGEVRFDPFPQKKSRQEHRKER